MQLTNRTILVTGGSAGIGLALATRFLELGNRVLVTGRSQARLDAAKAAHPGLDTYACDASDPEALRGLARYIDAEHPELDVLVNNAGVFVFRNLGEGADDLLGLTREMEVNFNGAVRTISVLIDRLRKNKGAIINVSSGLAFVPLQAAPIYCATKAALHSYTISLRQQLEGQVEVVELMPPAVRTDMTSDMHDSDAFTLISVDELVAATEAGLRAGHVEIRPGQSNQLHWMSRIAPGFINGQLAKGSADLIPQTGAAAAG